MIMTRTLIIMFKMVSFSIQDDLGFIFPKEMHNVEKDVIQQVDTCFLTKILGSILGLSAQKERNQSDLARA